MKFASLILSACAVLLFSCAALAAPGWIIATSGETIQAGETLQLEAVRPDEDTRWPEFLRLKLVTNQQTEIITFYPDTTAPGSSFRRTYAAALPQSLDGRMTAELADVASNRLMLLAANPTEQVIDAFPETVGRIDPIPEDEPALSAHEPVYFIVGTRNGLNARYQLSFKYRLFDQESTPVQWWPVLGQLHLGYTQTAVWDLEVNSKPFHDTSYRPSLFWQKRLDAGESMPRYLRAGYEHESNGRDGANSRSINLAYLQPAWRADFGDGKSLIFAPRFYSYLDKIENPDIARYRGYADWLLRYGDENEWVLSSRVRVGTAGYSSTQLDLSVPFRKPLFARTGGFVYLQLFNGYGETLLDYNQRHPAQLRIGFAIVR
ncbi:MAG TPA: phospholipase A [Gallionella sp.]|jgi:outer membrane phospholipase A|nr:phospholipase A [Gallionella sp.]